MLVSIRPLRFPWPVGVWTISISVAEIIPSFSPTSEVPETPSLPKSIYPRYFSEAYKALEPGGIIIIDSTAHNSELIPLAENTGFKFVKSYVDSDSQVGLVFQKPGFESLIRYIYTAPKEIYGDTFPRRGVYGAFNQYATEHLNKFAHNTKAWTRTKFWHWPHLFPKKRQRARQERIFQYYRERRMFDETTLGAILRIRPFHWYVGAQKLGKMVLNVEELATIFHPPMFLVLTGPLIKRVESRKIGPPAGLPIYGEEGEEKLPGIKWIPLEVWVWTFLGLLDKFMFLHYKC